MALRMDGLELHEVVNTVERMVAREATKVGKARFQSGLLSGIIATTVLVTLPIALFIGVGAMKVTFPTTGPVAPDTSKGAGTLGDPRDPTPGPAPFDRLTDSGAAQSSITPAGGLPAPFRPAPADHDRK